MIFVNSVIHALKLPGKSIFVKIIKMIRTQKIELLSGGYCIRLKVEFNRS